MKRASRATVPLALAALACFAVVVADQRLIRAAALLLALGGGTTFAVSRHRRELERLGRQHTESIRAHWRTEAEHAASLARLPGGAPVAHRGSIEAILARQILADRHQTQG